jgi:hypothetical protein
VPDGLFVPAVAGAGTAADPTAPLRFVPLPAPTTAEVEDLTATVARRLADRLAAASEERGSYLDPDLLALLEALHGSREAPPGMRDIPLLPGMEAPGEDGAGVQGKPLCASVAGFSLHAAQSVPAHDREALERLCRYGLRAPFSQERLSRRPDGQVVYRLRRPWPNAQGATHLVLEPMDFLRRLAAQVSFPYSHQVRYHGVFANRSRHRRMLPSPPTPPPGVETGLLASVTGAVVGPAPGGGAGGDNDTGTTSPSSRRRVPWAQLLRRVLSVDALSCPRCSNAGRAVPMTVLAFLTDPEVVGKILRHLGLPVCAPALAAARPAGRELGFAMPEHVSAPGDEEGGADAVEAGSPVRPPP